MLAVCVLAVTLGALKVFRHPAEREQQAGKAGVRPDVPIVTAPVKQGDIGNYLEALGTVTPLASVAITSRVQGQILSVAYREGQRVRRGDPLLEIDPRPYEAALLQAQGQSARDQALLKDSLVNLNRYRAAFAKHAISNQQFQDQEQLVAQYRGTVQSDRGVLQNAQVNLDYCHIRSPIDGRVGLRLIDAGNIVQANSTAPLAVVTQLAPITVVFSVPEDSLGAIQARLRPTAKSGEPSSAGPSTAPSADTSAAASAQPSDKISAAASAQPSAETTTASSAQPSAETTTASSAQPSAETTTASSAQPSAETTTASSAQPSAETTTASSAQPSAETTASSSAQPAPENTAAVAENSAAASPGPGQALDETPGPMEIDVYDRAHEKQLAKGEFLTLDNSIDPATGTVKLKGIFRNEDESLFPNQFVNVRLRLKTEHAVTTLASSAIQHDAQGAFVYVIKADKTAEMRKIKVGTANGDQTAVEGVKPGETVATKGFDKLQQGAKVVVRDESAPGPAPSSSAGPGTGPGARVQSAGQAGRP